MWVTLVEAVRVMSVRWSTLAGQCSSTDAVALVDREGERRRTRELVARLGEAHVFLLSRFGRSTDPQRYPGFPGRL